jgi:hypothetical protein
MPLNVAYRWLFLAPPRIFREMRYPCYVPVFSVVCQCAVAPPFSSRSSGILLRNSYPYFCAIAKQDTRRAAIACEDRYRYGRGTVRVSVAATPIQWTCFASAYAPASVERSTHPMRLNDPSGSHALSRSKNASAALFPKEAPCYRTNIR